MAVVDRHALAWYPFVALLRRELITHLRTRRLFFGLLALSLICAWIVLGQWPFGDQFDWYYLARRSESLFTSFAIIALTGGPIIVAAIASNALVGERERESWDLLRLSLISRMGIVAGKILSPIAMFGLTLAVCAPIVAALLFLAGVDFVRATQCLFLIVSTSFTCAAIALACSVRARRTITAATIAFFFVATFMGLGSVAVGAGLEFFDNVLKLPIVTPDMGVIFGFSPYFVLGNLLQSGGPVWPLLLWHFGFQAAVATVAMAYSVWALGRGELSPIDRPTGPRRRFRRGRSSMRASSRRAAIPDRSNPIFRRELYWDSPLSSVRARRFFAIAFVFALLVSAALSYTGASTTSRDSRLLLMLVATTIVGAAACLYLPIACANAYTKELAISNFDMLRGTLMHPADIVWGKFKAALVLCLVVWAASIIANLPVSLWFLGEPRGRYILFLTYGSLFAALVEAAVAGLFASFYSRRGGAAIVFSFLMLFVLYFGFFILAWLVVTTYGLPFRESSVQFRVPIATSPVMAFFWVIVDFTDRTPSERVIDWYVSLCVVTSLAVLSQLWMIARFHARVEKLADR